VGLGSDSVASNNRMSILEEARLAALFQGARLTRIDAVSSSESLAMAPLGGARAIGLADRVGTLEVGKDADLAAFDLRCARAAPLHDPEAAAVHALAGCDAVFVAVRGRTLVDRGHLVGEDPAVQRRVQESADRLGAWLAEQGSREPTPPVAATR
jgi:5-methylthioadenosine/S-adenosylhomocysteine deaminase